jgi:hypothetical protein
MKSLIVPFLFCWSFLEIRASNTAPPGESTQSSEPEPDRSILEFTGKPYFLQDRFLEANFFQDFVNATVSVTKKDFLNYIRYYFVTIEERGAFVRNAKLKLEIIQKLRGSPALETSIKRVTYLIQSGLQPALPECSMEDFMQNYSLLDDYVTYFFNTIEAVFEAPLPPSPDLHKLLFDKREVFFMGTLHTWVVAFRLRQR